MSKKLQVIELFGGIGAIRKALTRSGVEADYDYVEVDKNVTKAYNAIYNEAFEPVDVLDYEVGNLVPDLLFHGSPCQDFSVAGKQAGGESGSETRSSLLWRTIEIIKNASVKPKIVIWENVENVLSAKHFSVFRKYLQGLEELGYINSYKVINAKDKGIPQNRKRVFVVSIYQADKPFVFNDDKVPMRPLSEFIIDNEDTSLYLRQKSMKTAVLNGKIQIANGYVTTITTRQWRWNNAGVIRVLWSSFNQENYVINPSGGGTVGTITASGANSRQKLAISTNKLNFVVYQDSLEEQNYLQIIIDNKDYALRVISPREALLLMGFDDADSKAIAHLSKAVQYKVAGNSIVVQVLESIVKDLKAQKFL